jgi:hypothetical protein
MHNLIGSFRVELDYNFPLILKGRKMALFKTSLLFCLLSAVCLNGITKVDSLNFSPFITTMLAFVEVFEIYNLFSAIYRNWGSNLAPSSGKLLSFMVSLINNLLLLKFL